MQKKKTWMNVVDHCLFCSMPNFRMLFPCLLPFFPSFSIVFIFNYRAKCKAEQGFEQKRCCRRQARHYRPDAGESGAAEKDERIGNGAPP